MIQGLVDDDSMNAATIDGADGGRDAVGEARSASEIGCAAGVVDQVDGRSYSERGDIFG